MSDWGFSSTYKARKTRRDFRLQFSSDDDSWLQWYDRFGPSTKFRFCISASRLSPWLLLKGLRNLFDVIFSHYIHFSNLRTSFLKTTDRAFLLTLSLACIRRKMSSRKEFKIGHSSFISSLAKCRRFVTWIAFVLIWNLHQPRRQTKVRSRSVPAQKFHATAEVGNHAPHDDEKNFDDNIGMPRELENIWCHRYNIYSLCVTLLWFG